MHFLRLIVAAAVELCYFKWEETIPQTSVKTIPDYSLKIVKRNMHPDQWEVLVLVKGIVDDF